VASAILAACGTLEPESFAPTWTSLGLDGRTVLALAETPWGLYAGTGGAGVFRYDQTAAMWEPAGLTDQGPINDLLYLSTEPPRLLAAVGPRPGAVVDAVVFASDDGETWVPSDGGYASITGEGAAGYSLARTRSGQPELFVAAPGLVMRSTDAAHSWRAVFGDTTVENDVPRISIDQNGIVWVAANWVTACCVFHSADGGLTWDGRTPSGSLRYGGSWWSDVSVTEDGRLWMVAAAILRPDDPRLPEGTNTVAVSRDSGATYDLARMSHRGALLAIHLRFFSAADTLYTIAQQAGNALGVYRLRPGHTTLDEISASPGVAGGLSATLDAGGRLLVGTAGTGVWRMEW
jgi:hypothetical protein